jgi:hypothetical protein
MPTLDRVVETLTTRFFVDIGASDCPGESQSESLLERGWSGIMFEADQIKFSGLINRMLGKPVTIISEKVTPDNILHHLESANAPVDFYLSLDIDGYDYFVLEQILSKYRPQLIISEINEKIPPPLKFSVLYDPSYWWAGNHFYGYSLSMLEPLLHRYTYKVKELDYNNVILVPGEHTGSMKDIYDQGYWNRNRFNYNADFEPIYKMSTEDQIAFICNKFKRYEGTFLLNDRIHIENTGQVKLEQDFGQWISKYAADERFSKYVEIGTWNGRGSTCCFYDGFVKRTQPYSLQSYEISDVRVKEAKEVWKHVPDIDIIHGRMLQNHECPVYERVKELFPNVKLSWHEEDIRNFWSCSYVPMVNPEVVLLDGAEYLTQFEFESMKSIDSIRVFLLDDVCSDKCPRIFAELNSNPEWSCIARGNDRNGWAVFEKTSIDPKINIYRTLIQNAVQNAELGISKITTDIIKLDGMTGTKTRHFYNNMLTLEDTRYLEIGTWKGSSVCSAMCGNKAKVVCIDNWSEFGGPKSEFLDNFNRWKGENDAMFIEGDCFKVDISDLPKFNIYMYDGNHDCGNHYNALKYYYDHLDDTFIFIVDDWNVRHIREGTIKAIRDLNLSVLDSTHIRTNQNDIQTSEWSGWWDGMYVAILQKN